MSSWVRRGCLNWEGADILLSVRLQCFLSFQMTKASLSCIWELLGICLLFNPRAHALGRRLRQKQAHMASIRGGTPGSACPTAGVQEETGRLQHRQRKRVPAQLPGGGAGLREALWVEGSFVRERAAQACACIVWHTGLRRVCCFPSSSPFCKASWKSPRKNEPLVLGDLQSSFHCQTHIENTFCAGCQVLLSQTLSSHKGRPTISKTKLRCDHFRA